MNDETINPATYQQIFLALYAAARVIEKQDAKLSAIGQGENLSSVPAFYGVNFPTFLKSMASEIPLCTQNKRDWIEFFG